MEQELNESRTQSSGTTHSKISPTKIGGTHWNTIWKFSQLTKLALYWNGSPSFLVTLYANIVIGHPRLLSSSNHYLLHILHHPQLTTIRDSCFSATVYPASTHCGTFLIQVRFLWSFPANDNSGILLLGSNLSSHPHSVISFSSSRYDFCLKFWISLTLSWFI